MDTDSTIPKLLQLITLWEQLAQESALRVGGNLPPVQGAYFAGVAFGYEDCRKHLALAVADMQRAMTQGVQ